MNSPIRRPAPDGIWQRRGFKTERELQDECRIGEIEGLRPHFGQGLHAVPSLVAGCWERPDWPLAVGSATGVILLAVDGIGWPHVEGIFQPSLLVPLTSTFPSTSVAAWLTSVTGRTVAEHGVPGVVYRQGNDLLFNCLSDRAVGRSSDWTADDGAAEVTVGGGPTLFETLAVTGRSSVALPGDLANSPGRWADSVLRGARLHPSAANWTALRHRPAEAVAAVVAEIDGLIGAGIAGREAQLLWAFVHIDPYIHQHGYDASVLAALRSVQAAATRWAGRGFTVIVHGDHGLTRNRPAPASPAWREVNGPRWCRLPPGGAGRVLWWYPRPGCDDELLAHVRAAIDGSGFAGPATALEDFGLLTGGSTRHTGIGEVVAFALDESFPAFDTTSRYEHGSVTAEEMLTPIAVWGPAW